MEEIVKLVAGIRLPNDVDGSMQSHVTAMVSRFSERYPGCWQEVDKLRAKEQSAWPSYCFLPKFGAYWVISGGKKLPYAEELAKVADMQRMAVFAAWRVTQSIYRFDEVLFDALWETPVKKVPTELFRRLPEWCIYIEIPKPPYRGVFVHLEYSGTPLRDQLRIVFDRIDGTCDDLHFFGLHLDKEDVYEGLQSVLDAATKEATKNGYVCDMTLQDEAFSMLGNVASLVLYLCSIDADFEQPPPPTSKRTKQGLRIFPPAAPKFIDVGTRIGAVLRRGIKSLSENGEELGMSVRPHVRRAHHHHYWIGTKPNQQRVVKWLSPILVNIDKGEISTTIRPVKE